MERVTIRALRNHGGDVVDRVTAGETVVVTRAGTPVAELRPLRRDALDAAMLLGRWRNLASVEPQQFRADVDAVVDQSL
jgi:prevent-host-death family protein